MYFNDSEPYVAAWLRNLYPEATVDDRSILAVNPGDLPGHRRCHFFAGIGGWQYALELAGWPDAEPIWTASLPCQPFSAAGRAAGVCDERHLWPSFHRLVTECRPPVIVGEQVASRAGRAWLAGVRVELESLGYAVGAADLCAASVGAPHIRQRLFWVADRTGRLANAAGGSGTGVAGVLGAYTLQQGEQGAKSAHAGRDVRVADARGGSLRDGGRGQSSCSSAAGERATRERERIRADAGANGHA